jgi:hypothetical protein
MVNPPWLDNANAISRCAAVQPRLSAFGVKRTCLFAKQMSAIGTKRTIRPHPRLSTIGGSTCLTGNGASPLYFRTCEKTVRAFGVFPAKQCFGPDPGRRSAGHDAARGRCHEWAGGFFVVDLPVPYLGRIIDSGRCQWPTVDSRFDCHYLSDLRGPCHSTVCVLGATECPLSRSLLGVKRTCRFARG